jgi:uncharacterized Fe-S cluster-containing radical SAM superfamily protein
MAPQASVRDYIHPVLNEEIRAISGHYVLIEERRLAYNERKVLYFVGCAVADSSCCAAGGCAYALVPGFIRDWKYKTNPDNLAVSRVERIRDAGIQAEVRQLIQEKETVPQVNFE